tara:strand:- start:24 stop:2477 length:2454 start_codon:yes stop_codon:yes gene_type:complete
MEDETLDALTALYSTYPTSKNVDYSAFMRDFQPVESYPNYFVPQQGLLQNTPTLDTLSDLDIMQQRPQSLLDMINLYPTLENDFQRSFAVNPDTYNMNVYQPLPYDENYWKSKVGGTGGTGSSGLDLSGLPAIASAISLFSGGDDDDDGDNGGDGGDGGDGSSGTDVITANTTSTDTSGTQTGEGGDVESGSSDVVKITITDDDDSSQSTGQGSDVESGSSDVLKVTTTDSSDSQSQTGQGGDVASNTSNVLSATSVDSSESSATSGDVESGSSDVTKVSNFDMNDTSTWVWGGSPFKINVYTSDGKVKVIDIESKEQLEALVDTQNRWNQSGFKGSVFQSDAIGFTLPNNVVNTGSGLNFTTEFGVDKTGLTGTGKTWAGVNDTAEDILINTSRDLITNSTAGLAQFNHVGVGGNPDMWAYDTANNTWLTKAEYDLIADPLKANLQEGNAIAETLSSAYDDGGNIFSDAAQGVSNFLNKEIIAGTGGEGYLGQLTNVKVGEALSGVGMLMSLKSAIDDANVSNVVGTAAGAAGLGLFGANAQALATPLGAVALIAGLGGLGQPDPSNMTGFGATDLASGESVSFGMQGDKFNENNVNSAGNVANVMGGVVNNITSAFGLNAEGDILAQTGNRDPLNITFGDQESTQTLNDRLNYSTETGDITNSNDDITRLYYTGRDGNDGTTLADNLVKGTALLSLKAKANGEDSINIADITLPARSADDVKNTYLSQGFDETAADALTSAARSASGATSELLGGLLLANTTNEANYLTNTERTSLLEQGFTDEQLDTILYGTTEESITAVNLLNTNEENNEENI